MTEIRTHGLRRYGRRAVATLRSRLRRVQRDGGFILLESVIAISLITVVMSAVGVEYVAGLVHSNHQRSMATAVQLADSAMEDLRALHPSDLLTGRDQISVVAERNALSAISSVSTWIDTTPGNLAYDRSASSGGATAAVPTAAAPTRPGPQGSSQGIVFSVWKYLDCKVASADNSCRSAPGTVNFLRATVAVTWSQTGCPAGTCGYATSTFINVDGDPEFDDNQPLPPAPQIKLPSTASTTVEIGDVVSLQLLVKDGTGVPPFFWSATGLPTGLTISPDGLITGTIGGSNTTVTTISSSIT